MDAPITSTLTAETATAFLASLEALEPVAMPRPTSRRAVAKKAPAPIHYAEIREKISTSGGRTFGGYLVQGAQADVLAGQSVRIFGVWHNRREPMAYDLTFRVGDEAVYKSANFPYRGNITAIGEKTVTIKSGATVKRLDLAEFTALNWNYSAERVAKRQAEWLD